MTVNEGTITQNVYAGEATNADSENNVINISGGSFISSLIQSGNTYFGNVRNNKVNVTGGNFSGGWLSGGYIASGSGIASDNVLNILDGTFNVGYLEGSWGSGTHIGNAVNIMGGNISGGIISGAWVSDNTTASNNVVNISGGTINDSKAIAGGYIVNGYDGKAIGNTVNISGDAVINNSPIYGGWAPNGEARDNSINIYGSPDLSTSELHAGKGVSDEAMSGNSLNIYTKAITVKNVYDFNNINFYLPNDISAGDTVLTLTDSGGTDLINTAINPTPDKGRFRAIINGSSSITTGDKISLITNENGGILIGQNTFGSTDTAALQSLADEENPAVEADTTISKGVSMDYDMHLMLTDDGNNPVSGTSGRTIVGTVGNGTFTEPDFPNTVPVYIMQNHIPEISPVQENRGYEIFLNMGGGNVKIKTGHGTHIKTKTGNYDFGIARNIKTRSGNLIFAPVIEYGHGAYDTLLRKDIDGDGNASYIAGGVIARMINDSGFYYEGSFRAGRADTKFTSDSFMVSGQRSHVYYHTDAPIIATHARLGHQMQMGKDHHLDIYGIYSYARQGSSSADMSTGEHYNFSSVDGGRFRAGYRLTSRTSNISRIYSGLAYQYDTSVDSVSRWGDYSSPASGESGSSGMIELGWKLIPIEGNNWHLDINATAWVGHQKGAVAMAKVKKAF